MAENIVKEIEGVGESGVRCGVIGEIACSHPLKDSEKRALQAAAMAQTRTGTSIHLSPTSNDSWSKECTGAHNIALQQLTSSVP